MAAMVRNGKQAMVSADEEMDRDRTRNVQTLRGIINKHGWPTISMVGEDGFEAAWVIAQHADFDVEFQKTVLALMEKVPVGDKLLFRQAYIQDRILVNSGQPQLFGTQFMPMNGKMVPRPIQDGPNLDKRRKRYGLEPFEEHMKRFEGSEEDVAKRQLAENGVDWRRDQQRAA